MQKPRREERRRRDDDGTKHGLSCEGRRYLGIDEYKGSHHVLRAHYFSFPSFSFSSLFSLLYPTLFPPSNLPTHHKSNQTLETADPVRY